jgi:hypothetical protein
MSSSSSEYTVVCSNLRVQKSCPSYSSISHHSHSSLLFNTREKLWRSSKANLAFPSSPSRNATTYASNRTSPPATSPDLSPSTSTSSPAPISSSSMPPNSPSLAAPYPSPTEASLRFPPFCLTFHYEILKSS